jgi:hypothetical protein
MSNYQPPSLDDNIVVFPQDRQPPPPRSAEPEPPRNPFRVIIALTLVFILVASVGYSAIRPFVLGYIETADFDVALTSITAASDENCRAIDADERPFALNSTRTLCVCGVVFAGGRRADRYQLLLRDDGHLPVDSAQVERTADGAFCHRWELDVPLAQGEYRLDVRRDALLDTYWFRVQAVSSI